MQLSIEQEGHELLVQIRSSPECAHALSALQGEVLQIIVSDLSMDLRLAFRNRSVEEDPAAVPTITVAGEEGVISRILSGELDPLVAGVTRRLKAKVDPVRGPLLRTIFRAGRRRASSDMNWARIFTR